MLSMMQELSRLDVHISFEIKHNSYRNDSASEWFCPQTSAWASLLKLTEERPQAFL